MLSAVIATLDLVRLLVLSSSAARQSSKQHGDGGIVLCRICERHIMARQTAEHTRCCVLVSQCLQETATCDAPPE